MKRCICTVAYPTLLPGTPPSKVLNVVNALERMLTNDINADLELRHNDSKQGIMAQSAREITRILFISELIYES